MPRAARNTVTAVTNAVPRGRMRQAVVVIHGMGEQRPMSTLRSFVEAVWTTDHYLSDLYFNVVDPGSAPPNKSWMTPDARTGSHEQRRITTPYDVNHRRTDFYEIYWADITQGTTRGRLFAWMKALLWRKRSDIPADARRLYGATLFFALLFLLASLALAFSFWQAWLPGWATVAIVAIASVLFWALDQYVLPYFGDVAAYVRAEAGTVQKRAEVRERGLKLLRTLSKGDDYDRIVLVSHSLGSVIAYDLLQILWAEQRPWGLRSSHDAPLIAAIRAVEREAILPTQPPPSVSGGAFSTWTSTRLDRYRQKQWELYKKLRRRPNGGGYAWKVSDFVTLGSPLTHSEFLITHNAAHWNTAVMEHEFPVCPPLSDDQTTPTILFPQGRDNSGNDLYALHHGAVFAATRWTNIYDLGNLATSGDPISGHMWENFGPGVDNVRVELRWKLFGRFVRLFTHTRYWSLDALGTILAAPATPALGAPPGPGAGPGPGGVAPPGGGGDPSDEKPDDDFLGPTARYALTRSGAEKLPAQHHVLALRAAVDLTRRLGDKTEKPPPGELK